MLALAWLSAIPGTMQAWAHVITRTWPHHMGHRVVVTASHDSTRMVCIGIPTLSSKAG